MAEWASQQPYPPEAQGRPHKETIYIYTYTYIMLRKKQKAAVIHILHACIVKI